MPGARPSVWNKSPVRCTIVCEDSVLFVKSLLLADKAAAFFVVVRLFSLQDREGVDWELLSVPL